MNFEVLNTDLRLSKGLIGIHAHSCGVMEGGTRISLVGGRSMESKKPHLQRNVRRAFPSNYYSVESFMVLLCLTASLLILPLILPPLPPPPFLLLLLPIGILVVLLILAFMPSDVRDIASSYL